MFSFMKKKHLWGWCRAALLGLAFPMAAIAADRVLVMTISDYKTAPLPGAARDQGNYKLILTKMGVASDNVRFANNGDLTRDGMLREFEQLVNATGNGDRVYLFFSGHGTSVPSASGGCEQALVTYDIKKVFSAEIAAYLNRLKEKASQVVMFLDACHSGGVVSRDAGTRSIAKAGSRFRPRFMRTAGGEACARPSNVIEEQLTRGMSTTRGISVAQNYMFLAAARSDEVAFDDEENGGLSTSSLLHCLTTGVEDEDRSGNPSFKELVRCAQERINANLEGDPVNRPHHITTAGNSGLPIAAKAVGTATPSGRANPVATLKDLLNGSDRRWQVRVQASPPRAKIGRDAFRLSIQSSQDGYLYLLYVGSDQKEFLQLYPQAPDQPNRVRAGQPFVIPGQFAAGGPAGTNHVLALISHQPRSFQRVFDRQGSAQATLGSAVALQDVMCSSRSARQACQGGNTPVAEGVVQTYGASLIELVEEN